MRLSHAVTVALPREAFFDMLADRERVMHWLRTGSRIVARQGDGTQTGDSIESVQRQAGAEVHTTHVVLEYRRPELLAYATEMAAASSVVANRLAEAPEGGTRWQVDTAITLKTGLSGIAAFFARPAFQRQVVQGMQTVRASAEAEYRG